MPLCFGLVLDTCKYHTCGFIIVVLCAFQSGGRFLQEGMEENSTLTVFDLRLSEIAQESEYVINKTVKDNLDRDRKIAT